MNFIMEEFKQLEPYFNKNEVNCAFIARETGFSHSRVVSYYSVWIRDITKNSEAAKADARIDNLPPRCPTCGKLKDEVTDMAVCRDVFHYL